jgi:hypothetical protein
MEAVAPPPEAPLVERVNWVDDVVVNVICPSGQSAVKLFSPELIRHAARGVLRVARGRGSFLCLRQNGGRDGQRKGESQDHRAALLHKKKPPWLFSRRG